VDTELLVIGAGPYGLSAAGLAREHGIETVVVGRPMDFWRSNMPPGMFLRSSSDWHLDGADTDTFEAYLEECGTRPEDVDPIPVELFLDYAEWFARRKSIDVDDRLVDTLTKPHGRFEATLENGERIIADAVVAAPGIRHFQSSPDWTQRLDPELAVHTCELVRFGELSGARVLIVGGRQSAYEWAALIHEGGAERIDIVHRHDVPRFERVSWEFIDPHVESTTTVPGYWRKLPKQEQEAIAQRFWELGRLTLEYWLTPRLEYDCITRHPGTEVVEAAAGHDGELHVTLHDATTLTVDRIVIACGYRADIMAVPYLRGLEDDIQIADGCPVLDEGFQTTLDGLYITGFSATRDFGPFFGFVKGAPASSTVIVRDLLSRG
jgi:Pyridine nucleotide-disulphide oxidoreductase